jgi:hypothetical protein
MKHLKTFEGFYLDEIKKIKASTIPQIEEVKKQFQQDVKEIFNIFEDEFNYDFTIENLEGTDMSMALEMEGFKKEEMDKVYDTLEIIHNRTKSEDLQFDFQITYIIPDTSNPDDESWDDTLFFSLSDEDCGGDGTISGFRKIKEIQKIEKGNVRKRIITIIISDEEVSIHSF